MPAVVALMANAVNITPFIVQGILVWSVMAGLLLSLHASHNRELPATAVLPHSPLAIRFRI
jgi:hypothetical protein